MTVKGIICDKIGDWKEVLSPCDDIEKRGISFEVPNGCAKIKVAAGGLCFPDVLIIGGKHMFKREPPFIPCVEVAGEILEINADASSNRHGFKVGDKVFGTALTGALATHAICSLDAIYKCSDKVDLLKVAGFEVNYGTTYHALVDNGRVKPGETLLVLGASGGVGMAAIDVGKALGMKVVACASTEEKLSYCKQAGADILINYSQGDLKTLLKKAKVYGKIDVIYDPVGGNFTEPAFRALNWGGRLIVIGFAAGGDKPTSAIPRLPLNLALLSEREVVGSLFGAWKLKDRNVGNRKNMNTMMKMLEEGKLNPVVSKVYNLNNYPKAFEAMMTRQVIGKVVVDPSATHSQL